MALSAADSIHRGLVNLRANWEVVCFQWLQVLIVAVLTVAGFLPPLAVLGAADLQLLGTSGQDFSALVAQAVALTARGREAWVLLLASLVLASAIWFMAMLVYCYFQGGILGVLMAGDRQAPTGRQRRWQWFRTFSVHDLRGWAGRYLWRYFWLFHLFMLVLLVWSLLLGVVILLATWGQARWGVSAALGIGCGGAIPMIFSLFVGAFWFNLAQADLAREESSVWVATRRALAILGGRLGAVVILFLLGLTIAVCLGMFAGALSTVMATALRGSALVQLGGQLALSAVEWIASSVVGVAFMSILIALVDGEMSGEVAS